mgnify:CR=1
MARPRFANAASAGAARGGIAALRTHSSFRGGFAEHMDAGNSRRVGAGTIAMGVAAAALDRAGR